MKKNRTCLLCICAICLVLQLAGTRLMAQTDSSRQLSLKECLDLAFANNLDLKQSELLAATAGIDYRQARQNMLPQVNGIVEHGSNQGRSIDPFTNSYLNQKIDYANYGVNAGIVLFNGLSTQHAISQLSFQVKILSRRHCPFLVQDLQSFNLFAAQYCLQPDLFQQIGSA